MWRNTLSDDDDDDDDSTHLVIRYLFVALNEEMYSFLPTQNQIWMLNILSRFFHVAAVIVSVAFLQFTLALAKKKESTLQMANAVEWMSLVRIYNTLKNIKFIIIIMILAVLVRARPTDRPICRNSLFVFNSLFYCM